MQIVCDAVYHARSRECLSQSDLFNIANNPLPGSHQNSQVKSVYQKHFWLMCTFSLEGTAQEEGGGEISKLVN